MGRGVCLLTSVHPAFDTRVFYREAKTLAAAGYDVALVAQHDTDEVVGGIRIVALPKPKNRLRRMTGLGKVLRIACAQRADVYHLHDPELLPVGVALKALARKKIIYDVHENVRGQILTKTWLPKPLRKPLSVAYQVVERLSLPFVDRVVIAEDSYSKNYGNRQNVTAIRNYPLLINAEGQPAGESQLRMLLYVGLVSRARGALELVEAVGLLKGRSIDVDLTLVGPSHPDKLRQQLRRRLEQLGIEDNVHLPGRVRHEEVFGVLAKGGIGLAILHPEPNYMESLPTKLYEYMAAGLPVIASDFPLWSELVEGEKCGLTVDPLSPGAIAAAIQYLLEHPDEARRMGDNGRQAVKERYSWGKEGRKLLTVYERLVPDRASGI